MARTTFPTLHKSNELDFVSIGYGFLSDGISCEVTEELGNSFELTLEYPITGMYYNYLQIGLIICAKTNTYSNTRQPFRIYRITKPIDGIITVYAQHISYDLEGYATDTTLTDYENTPADVSTIIDFIQSCSDKYSISLGMPEFRFSIDGEFDDAPFSISSFGSVRSIMQIAAKQFNGQWEYNGYDCILHKRRGQDRGVSVEYGKNLVDLTEDADISETYTHIMPFYKGTEEVGDERQDVVVGGLSAVVATGAEIGTKRTKTVDFSSEYKYTPSIRELQESALNYAAMQEVGQIVISRDLKAVDRGKTIEYPGLNGEQIIEIGDTVKLSVPVLGIDTTMECTRITYNVYLDIVENYAIGHLKKSYISTVKEHEDKEDEDIEGMKDDIDTWKQEINSEIEDIENQLQERAPTLFVQEEEPEGSENNPLVNGDYWLQTNSNNYAIALHKYTSVWGQLCSFGAGGSGGDTEEIYISVDPPEGELNNAKQYDILLYGSSAATVEETPISAIKEVYEFSSAEAGGNISWRSIPFGSGGSAPSLTHTTNVGDYWITVRGGYADKIYICTAINGNFSTWDQVYPTDETERNPTVYISSSLPIMEGAKWIKLESTQTMNAECMMKYGYKDNKADWVLEYNIQATVYADTNAPDPEDEQYEKLKKGDIWVKINDDVDRLAQQIAYWNGTAWMLKYKLADRPPTWYVSNTDPSEGNLVKTTDYWLKKQGDTINELLTYQIDQEAESGYSWNSLGKFAPQFLISPTDPLLNEQITVNTGDYWLKIDAVSTKNLLQLSQCVDVVENNVVTGKTWNVLYNIAAGGGGSSNLIVNIDYAIMVSPV